MLRVSHNGTVLGPILIDDIDDGLPNKEVHRLVGDPRSYSRDGYATHPKQRCYVPLTHANLGLPQVQGYINLYETDRVTLSAAKGKIAALVRAGLVSVTQMSPDSVATPTLASATYDGTTLTLTGTTFESVPPDVTYVVATVGSGQMTLTADQITTGSGTVSATSITIPGTLISGLGVGSQIRLVANSKSTATVAVTA